MKPPSISILSACLIAAFSCNDSNEIRNIALHRAAYHSSATDYNYTAQLVTDGIVEKEQPVFYEVLENGAPAPKHRKESPFQSRRAVHYKIYEPHYELAILEHGIHKDVDEMRLNMALRYKSEKPSTLPSAEIFATSDGGATWQSVHKLNLDLEAGRKTAMRFGIQPDNSQNGWKLVLDSDAVKEWVLLEWDFYNKGERLNMLGNQFFRSIWVAGDAGPQWLAIDLGSDSRLSKSVFHWTERPSSGSILISTDGHKWRKAGELKDKDEVELKGHGRYIRLEMEPSASGAPLALSEWEVWGKNAMRPAESRWTAARADQADNPQAWMPVKVPGTILSSYIDNGAVPDISYANDQEYISDSYFNSDFIYRGKLPFDGADGRRVFLDFGGINWKADVRLNGTALGSIEGAFTRGRFDVTGIVRKGDNDVEVLIHRPDHPGGAKGNTIKRIPPNGGILGADNPTFHASIGWDWIPTVRGRNIGIWREVGFCTSGDITVADPLVQTKLNLPDTTLADITLEAVLTNHSRQSRQVLWKGNIGDCRFAESVVLAGGETRRVTKALRMENPRLWWPNNYGEQYLYDASVSVEQDGQLSDSLSFKSGLRQMSYSVKDGRLTAWVNGRRISGLGGNWGFSELNLRYTARDYDIAVGYHKQMNFNMIRNWVGQTGDEEFYEACDRHGIMVWQDFWLANPSDGPDPDDESLFEANARDYVSKIRRHPSVVLYCGRNEGMPPVSLDKTLERLTAELHPDIIYIPDSADDVVSGRGPYNRLASSEFFNLPGQDRMHSERGTTAIPNYESLARFIPKENRWPQNDMWGVHDWATENAQKVGIYSDAVTSRFGEPVCAEQFCDLAQWVSYDAFRAIFESRSPQRRGMLLWMSHNAWPSLTWCPYDYYYDPHAGFFGSKKGCEPIHIQYNAGTGHIEVVNWCAGDLTSLTASARVLDTAGNVVSSFECRLDSPEDSRWEGPSIELKDGVSYLELALSASGTPLSENFYVLSKPEDDFRALNDLPKTSVKKTVTLKESDDCYLLTVSLENESSIPALMLKLQLLNDKPVNSGPSPSALSTSDFGSTHDDCRILPVFWSDNYFSLMPGQKRTVTASIYKEHFEDRLKPSLELEGFNI